MHRSNTGRSLGILAALVAMVVLSSCNTDWSTWGGGRERTGFNSLEHTVNPGNVSKLHQQWATELPSPPGLNAPPPAPAYINASPVVAVGIPINGTSTDVVYVGNEEGAFHAVSTKGNVLWSRNLGRKFSNCPNTPDSQFGVSASAVFDRTSNRVYVVGGDGYAYALDPSTGATLAGWPVQITADPLHEFVYSAPTLSGHNLYIGLSARCDLMPYHGRLLRIDTENRATNAFFVTGSATGPSGGSIWGWGGASVDPATGDVYVATGNTIADPQNAAYGEAIVRLTRDLQVVAYNRPGYLQNDDDFGSTPVLFRKPGCPPQLATQQKNGTVYLYDRDNIAAGPRQAIQTAGPNSINVPAWSPANQTLYVVNWKPHGYFSQGLVAFKLNADCKLSLAWQTPVALGLGSTPTIANGVVYFGGGIVNKVYALNANTGAVLWSSGAEITGHTFPAPVMINGQLLVTGYDGKLRAYGLP